MSHRQSTAGDSEGPTGNWPAPPHDALRGHWRSTPPVLRRGCVTLREAGPEDAPALLSILNRPEVRRVAGFVPASIEAFERSLDAGRARRLEGREICFAVLPDDRDTAVGLFRVRETEPGFGAAEWEFVLAPECWGRGLFFHAAPLVVDFVFGVLGAHRLEARAVTDNGRGAGALRKLGAVQEGVLREAWWDGRQYRDQVLWTLAADDWQARTRRRAVH